MNPAGAEEQAMKPMPTHVPAVVIGAGPTGAAAANLLGRLGVRCLVLDRYQQVYPLPRAVHFDDEVFRVFAAMGLEEEVRTISRPIPGMRLVDARHRVLAELRRDPTSQRYGYPQANMFDQPELEQVLRTALGRFPQVLLRTGVEVVAVDQPPGGPAPARVRWRDLGTGAEGEVWTHAVLGCDGANSSTRAVVGATMEDFRFEQQWLVVDAHSPEPLRTWDGVHQVCDHDRAATFMPVVAGRYRWEFRLKPHERPEDFDHQRILELIRPWLHGVEADKLAFLRQTCYTFRGLVADRWRNGRVFLLGDAAHQTPPFIGQGMCAGIRDAANLTWKLALVLKGQADDRILDTYETERHPHARRVVRLAIVIGWLMTGGSARTARLRRLAMRLATRMPGVEDKMMNTAWPAFAAGPLVSRRRRDQLAGHPCPQPRLRTGTGSVPLDRLLGDGFTVICRGADRTRAFDPDTRRYFDQLGITVLRVGDPAHDGVADPSGVLTGLLDDARADALLLRPDRVVAAAADTADLRAWRRQLEGAGIAPTSL
jgi:3-(3-hydroxy-phenyl)propionate hydroxylase